MFINRFHFEFLGEQGAMGIRGKAGAAGADGAKGKSFDRYHCI